MRKVNSNLSTGLSGLDHLFTKLLPGDNVVWQVNAISDYTAFVHPFCEEAIAEQRPLVYFRFADHERLLPKGVRAQVYELRPEEGFESFITEIFDVIERVGVSASYVFDSLSELAVDWYSDRMLANFFSLTCPYLQSNETVAYFALRRDCNTSMATDAIHATAQIVLDVYRDRETLYLHPLKVDKRHSDTMYMLHAWHGDRFEPICNSATTARVLTSVQPPKLGYSIEQQDTWTRTFAQAQKALSRRTTPKAKPASNKRLTQQLIRMAITRDPQLLRLADKYFALDDLVNIGKRMIGTGLIGGKAAGMLLARAILHRSNRKWVEHLEAHDSFFVATDVFYTYLVINGCWWVRRQLKNPETALDKAQEAKDRMLTGSFPKDIQDQFSAILDYFGQSPIILRSSSLLEDAYGNAFSGKYESVICSNQGTPAERLDEFMKAVKSVYASTVSREALEYRMHWGLLERDEQMALLIQRISGQSYGHRFYPHIAGAGYSFNPFVWTSEIDPRAGFLRIVFGLGTRAMDRTDDDYARVVALNRPLLRPESSFEQLRKVAQRRVDLIDLRSNQHESRYFEDAVRDTPELPLHLFASRDLQLERRAAEFHWSSVFSWVLTFEEVLTNTAFIKDLREILTTIEKAYAHPVDIEFTANFADRKNYYLNLLQCRPFQVRGGNAQVVVPRTTRPRDTLLKTQGPIIGNSLATVVDRLIYVAPNAYNELKQERRYALARLIGRLTHLDGADKAQTIVLVGPGRWGTSTPSLGVPVMLADINTVKVLCECALMHSGLVPEVSLATHFFNDIVELDMRYLAVYPERPGYLLNRTLLDSTHNALPQLLPDEAGWSDVLRVLDESCLPAGKRLYLKADAYEQHAVCYIDRTFSKSGGAKTKGDFSLRSK